MSSIRTRWSIQFGADAFRFSLREVPFDRTAIFIQRAGDDRRTKLANGINNLLSRTLTDDRTVLRRRDPRTRPSCAAELKQLIELPSTLPNKPETGFKRPAIPGCVLLTIEELNGLCDEYIDKARPGNWRNSRGNKPNGTVLNTSPCVLDCWRCCSTRSCPNADPATWVVAGPFQHRRQRPSIGMYRSPTADQKDPAPQNLVPHVKIIGSEPKGQEPVSDTPASPQPTAAARSLRCTATPCSATTLTASGSCSACPDHHRRFHEDSTQRRS